jgi:hypothetical protein
VEIYRCLAPPIINTCPFGQNYNRIITPYFISFNIFHLNHFSIDILRKFRPEKGSQNRSPTSLSLIDSIAISRARNIGCYNPFAAAAPTRRLKPADNSSLSVYSPPSNSAILKGPMQTAADSPYAFLTQFDTVFLIDDSGSMAGRS